MEKNRKAVNPHNVKRWMPHQRSHFGLTVLLIMVLLFVVFYFFVRNKVH